MWSIKQPKHHFSRLIFLYKQISQTATAPLHITSMLSFENIPSPSKYAILASFNEQFIKLPINQQISCDDIPNDLIKSLNALKNNEIDRIGLEAQNQVPMRKSAYSFCRTTMFEQMRSSMMH